MIRSFVAVVLLAMLVGCSAKGQLFSGVEPRGDQAVVYIYRPSNSYVGSGVVMKIDVDGERVGKLKNQGYLFKVITPGSHLVSCKIESESLVPIEAVAGGSYYIEAETEPGILMARPRLTQVPEGTGELAIRSTRFSGGTGNEPAE